MRVDKSGEDALSVAIDDFCGIAYPYGYACLVTYIYELAVLDSNGFCMCLLSIQCDGINFCIPVNFVCNLCHNLILFIILDYL